MHIVIPVNFAYLRARYCLSDEFARLLLDLVVPDLVERLSRDSRVSSVELISDRDFGVIFSGVDKVVVTTCAIDPSLDSNQVVSEILSVRQTQASIVVQCNPLFPFVSVESMCKAYETVRHGTATSAVGAFFDKHSVKSRALAKEYDLGIFTVYSVDGFMRDGHRVSLPFEMIGLRAVELIGLRNTEDFDLFSLIVNSGFEL